MNTLPHYYDAITLAVIGLCGIAHLINAFSYFLTALLVMEVQP